MFLLLLSLFGCPKQTPEVTPPQPDQPGLEDPLPVDPNVRMGVLDNGMHWYVEVNKKPENRAVFRMAVDAGSILEDDDQRGLAHFVEHMAFNGSDNFEGNELIEYLESVGTRFGAHLNAHTSTDETVYKLQVPTDDMAIFDKAFVVFDDWAGGITNSDEEIEKERGVVLEEWRSRRGAGARIGDAMRPWTMYGSPYVERKTIGTEESLTSFEPEAVRRFYTDWYRPDLMAIIVVGDFDPDYVEGKIKEHFSDLEMPEEPRERRRPTLPDHDETFVEILTDPELTRTSVGITHKHDDIETATHGAYREMLVDRLIHGMVNERFGVMSRNPDAPFLGAFTGSGKMTPIEGYTGVNAATPEGGELDGLRAIATEIERVRRHGFNAGELQRAVDGELRGYQDYYNERDTTPSRVHADEIVRVYLTGESMPGIAYEWKLAQQFLGDITVEDVNQRAKDHWMLDHSRVIAITLPEKEGLTPPTQEQVLAVLEEVKASEIEPPVDDTPTGPLVKDLPEPGEIAERTRIEELDTTVWTLSNGITVYIKPTEFKTDEVLLRSHSPGGHATVADDEYVPATTATGIRGNSGLGDFTAVQLSRYMAGKQASASSWIGAHHEGVSGSASPENLEELFQMVYLNFTAPRFDQDAADVYTRARAEGLRNRLSSPNAIYGDRFNELMWGGHPRHSPWSLKTLDEMDLQKSKAIYENRFADASDFTFTLVGNLDLEALEPLVAQYLATLPSTKRQDVQGDDGARRATGIHKDVVRAGLEPKARFGLEMHGSFEGSWEERNRLFALREVLSVMLRRELREELGGVYGVGVSAGTWELPEPGYRLGIGFQCDPDRVEELEAATMAVLNKVLEEGVDPDDVADVKAKNARSRRGADPRELLLGQLHRFHPPPRRRPAGHPGLRRAKRELVRGQRQRRRQGMDQPEAVCPRRPPARGSRGMSKAKNLGLALIALSFIEIAWVLFCVFGGLLLGLAGFADAELGAALWIGTGAYWVLALFNLPVALLHLYAGTQLRKGKGLILAIAALAACMPQMVLALYCFPFEAVVLIFGIVVLADAEVRELLDSN